MTQAPAAFLDSRPLPPALFLSHQGMKAFLFLRASYAFLCALELLLLSPGSHRQPLAPRRPKRLLMRSVVERLGPPAISHSPFDRFPFPSPLLTTFPFRPPAMMPRPWKDPKIVGTLFPSPEFLSGVLSSSRFFCASSKELLKQVLRRAWTFFLLDSFFFPSFFALLVFPRRRSSYTEFPRVAPTPSFPGVIYSPPLFRFFSSSTGKCRFSGKIFPKLLTAFLCGRPVMTVPVSPRFSPTF